MELRKEILDGMKTLWDSEVERLNVQIVLHAAFSQTAIDYKTANEIFEALDELLLTEAPIVARKDSAL